MNNLKNINPQTAVRMFTGTGHYKLGQVYKDENGHRWIVVHMSGQGNGVAVDKEATPYCELMSFDGLTASGDHSYVTNLPTFNQAIRGVFRLTNLFTNYILIQDSDLGTQAKLVKNVLDATGVDFRKLFQLVKAVSGNPRNASMHVSVAYRDPAINYAQPLIRYLRLIDLNNENPPYYLRSVYPLNPNSTLQTYPAGSFSTTPILLQDVADAAMVARYATDLYAWRPVDTNTGGDGTSNRECRTKADPRALDVTNYYYNQAVWRNYQYPLDMWNSPVLMFRYTAVYDCGDTNFDRKTIDGHTLTFFKESGDLETINNELELSMAIGYLYTLNGAIDMDMFSTSITQLNGVSANMPTWRDAWGQ
jgi:hypothetical protein